MIMQLTEFQIGAIAAFVGNFVWVIALAGMMAREFRKGLKYPWPAWATPRRFRKDGVA